ncbi:hypothetical protein ES702_05228 [subsurface metagenome]
MYDLEKISELAIKQALSDKENPDATVKDMHIKPHVAFKNDADFKPKRKELLKYMETAGYIKYQGALRYITKEGRYFANESFTQYLRKEQGLIGLGLTAFAVLLGIMSLFSRGQ